MNPKIIGDSPSASASTHVFRPAVRRWAAAMSAKLHAEAPAVRCGGRAFWAKGGGCTLELHAETVCGGYRGQGTETGT